MTGTRTAKPVPPEVIERLKAVVGPAGTIDDPADIAPYCKSLRDDWDGRVPLVLRPQSTERSPPSCASAPKPASPSCPRAAIPG